MEGVRSHGHSSLPKPIRLPSPQHPTLVFERMDIYELHKRSPMARLELVLAHYAHCLIDALEDTLMALPMWDRLASFNVGGFAPSTT
jgi:hypothetical protein